MLNLRNTFWQYSITFCAIQESAIGVMFVVPLEGDGLNAYVKFGSSNSNRYLDTRSDHSGINLT